MLYKFKRIRSWLALWLQHRRKEIIACCNPSKMIVFDLETTGLDDQKDEILQISIIDGDGNTLINEYVHPVKKESWDEAQRINGITPEMVENAPYPYKLIPKVKGIFQAADLIVSYNGVFDLKFLSHWGITADGKTHYDVMRKFAPVYGEKDLKRGGYKWKKLTVCAEYYGYKFKAHDSLEDVKATLFCYRNLTA